MVIRGVTHDSCHPALHASLPMRHSRHDCSRKLPGIGSGCPQYCIISAPSVSSPRTEAVKNGIKLFLCSNLTANESF